MRMTRIFLACFLALFISNTVVAAEAGSAKERMSAESASQIQMAKNQLDAAKAEQGGQKRPDTFVVVMPQAHYTKTESATRMVNGSMLKHGGGHSNGTAVNMLARKQVNDFWGIGLMAFYANIDYAGSIFTIPAAQGKSYQSAEAYMIGVVSSFDFKKFGKLNFVGAHTWNTFQGYEQASYGGGAFVDRRDLDDQTSTVLSLKLWYDLDIPITDQFTLTPYLGYRYMWLTADKLPDWKGPGYATYDWHDWTSFGTAGSKFRYKISPFTSIHARGGYTYRFRSEDRLGFAARFGEQSAGYMGWNVNMDRGSVTFGAGIDHAMPKRGLVLGLKYDGFVSSHVESHMATATCVLMF